MELFRDNKRNYRIYDGKYSYLLQCPLRQPEAFKNTNALLSGREGYWQEEKSITLVINKIGEILLNS